MWLEIRKFYDTLHQFDSFNDETACSALFENIDKYKFRLQNILCNTAKSTASRNKVVANSQITLNGIDLVLDSAICSEALIISDIFQLNELESVELILSGESQRVNLDGMNRGLVAVVCYYDAHRLLVSALRDVLRWDREYLPEKLVQLIETFFVQESVFKHLMQLQGTFNVQAEFNRLMQPNVNGLGGSKHQKLLRNAIEEIRQAITDCTILLCRNPGTHALAFSNFLFQVVKNVGVSEKLSTVNLAAWIALVQLTSSDVLNQVGDAATVLNGMISHIRDETTWSDQSMCGSVQLVCAVTLRALASSPADHLGIETIKTDVDRVIDRAIRNMAFQYIRHAVIGADSFNLPFQFLVVDDLFKKLISFFPAKLMETERNSADELAWLDESTETEETSKTSSIQSNVQQPSAANYSMATLHYENFLCCIADLYRLKENDTSSKWKKLHEQISESSTAFCTEGSIELCRLLERARLRHHFVHAVAYLDLAAAVCRSSQTAAFFFDIFAREYPGTEYFGWESLMNALRSYERLFREQKQALQRSRVQTDKIKIPTAELSGLLAWLRLATKVAEMDDEAAQKISEDRSWCAIDVAASVATAPVPLSLKAQLLNFLAALARIRNVSGRVWSAIYAHQMCYFSENGVLMGLQQELDERECVSKQYDVSLAFVHLISTLVKQKFLPEFVSPFVQFVTKSVLSQFASRSYNDVRQMWKLAETALEAINRLLDHGVIEPRAVTANEVHINVLANILNDTPVFRALCRVLLEDCDAYVDPYSDDRRLSSDSALLAIQILSKAIRLMGPLRQCCRAGESDVIVASIQTLVFTPIYANTNITLLDIIFQYLQQVDDLPVHAMFAAQMLRDVSAARGSQKTMLDLLRARDCTTAHVRALRAALCASSINYTLEDSLGKDVGSLNLRHARGETARILLETLADSIDLDPSRSNLCYYLLALRPSRANSKELYDSEEMMTGLHHVLFVIEQFVTASNPFDLSFSAILEPSFRLMQRLVAVSCPFSKPVLCFMRSYDLVERLVTSPFMKSSAAMKLEYDDTFANGTSAIRRMIVGYILHFVALEASSMLACGHYTKPEVLYRALVERRANSMEDGTEEEDNLLSNLLRQGNVTRTSELLYPPLIHFDAHKLQGLFDSCLTVTVYGVSQYDVVYLHRLLRREIEAVYSECEEVRHVQKEMESILEYCAELNANLLSEGASDRIVSGCTALLNVFSVFAPVPFLPPATQLDIFRDACYVLIEMVDGIAGASLLAICETLRRLGTTICRLSKTEMAKLSDLRKYFAPLIKSIIEVVVQPGDKGIESKILLYKTLRLLLRSCFETVQGELKEAENWLLDGRRGVAADDIVCAIESFSDDVGRHLVKNITDFPLSRKTTAVLLASDILHEDLKGGKKLAAMLTRSGVPRLLCETLLSAEFDWKELAGGEKSKVDVQEHISSYNLLTSILVFFNRLAASEQGWTCLSELSIIEVIGQLNVFTNPPKQLFLQPLSVQKIRSDSNYFVETLDLALNVCKQMCTNNKWKKEAVKVLRMLHGFGEVFHQLMRAEVHCELLSTAQSIVREICLNDENVAEAVESDPVLQHLQAFESNSLQKTASINSNSSFATPRRLFAPLIYA